MKAPLHFHAWLLVAACFVSALSVTAQAADGVPAPASSADAAIVKRIFGNWKAREERTRSFHVEWNTRVVQTLRRSSSVEELRRAFWVEGGDRFRLEFWRRLRKENQLGPHGPRAAHMDGHRRDDSGMAIRSRRGSAGSCRERHDPGGSQRPGAHGTRPRVPPVATDGRAGLPVPPRDRACHRRRPALCQAPATAARVGLGRALLGRSGRDDVPILWEKTLQGETMWRVAIQYRLSRDHNLGWVPERWTCQNDGAQLHVLQCTVTKLSVNESLPTENVPTRFPARHAGL